MISRERITAIMINLHPANTEIITAKQLVPMVNLQDPLEQTDDLSPLQPGLDDVQDLPGDGLVVDGQRPLEDVLFGGKTL